ncbi:MAG: glucosamine-6-phosphate deaminase [Clostridia bacterium]|jgi:glucosamine-6-phosphate deaminase|nr:glucosamine-6-phosphate deaminase [Clostridia bacterium]
MQVHVFDNAQQVGQAAAELFAAQVISKPNSVLGLATGSSPLGCYKQLIEWHKAGLLDFSQCVSYNLDEYVGIPETHPESYHQFMKDNLFNFINMKETHVPNGNAEDLWAEAARYDAAIEAAGGIDMQLLGIGRNGHIGFNEPAEQFVYGTQIVNLTESTIQANRRFFDSEDQVPRKAISLGIGGIMHAKAVVLIAMGEDKAQAIHDTVKGNVTPKVQASILRLHPNATILVDKAAASLL